MNTVAALPPQLPGKKKKKKLITALVIVGVSLFAAWGVLNGLSAGSLFSSKSTILFEPDTSKGASYSDVDLLATAVALQKRWDILGYGVPWTKFTVLNNKVILGRIPKKLSADFIDNTLEMGVVEFVDLGDTYLPPGAKIATDANNTGVVRAPGRVWHTLFSNEVIQTINLSRAGQSYVVDFTLNQVGTKLFAEYTNNNVGSYLAIVKDKVVVSCPSISQPVSNGSGQMSGSFTEQEAKDLVMVMETTPLQVPLKWRVITTEEHILIIFDLFRDFFRPKPLPLALTVNSG